MKRKAILLAVALSLPQSAMADVYVKVDANGNAIGGAIMCDAATCGEGSQYSQLTLQPGERYQLQGVGVHYGIGNNNPGVEVKHEATTNEWVVTNNNAPAPVVERFTVNTPAPVVQDPVPVSTPVVDTKTVIVSDTSTVLVDSRTATIDYSATDWANLDWTTFDWEDFLAWLTVYIEDLLAVKP